MTSTSAPWRCDQPGTFAHTTCVARWPGIVASLADDVPHASAALGALRDEVAGGVVRALAADNPERGRWEAVAPFVGGPWTALPWYVGESFLYARIREAVGYHASGVDPFLPAKLREERALAPPGAADGDDDHALLRALGRALWGNRADLSLPSAREHTGVGDADLVIDERMGALALLARAGRVAILLDNAGAELAADLALARVLAARGVAVTLIAKDAPFFVSDASPDDVARLRGLGHDDGGAVVVADSYLTGPGFLVDDELPTSLRRLLVSHDVVVAKGDCNYRRLVRDRPWRADDRARFDEVVALPVPLVTLRTLKAEVLVGVSREAAAAAAARDPAWLVSGRFGVVQVALPRREAPSEISR